MIYSNIKLLNMANSGHIFSINLQKPSAPYINDNHNVSPIPSAPYISNDHYVQPSPSAPYISSNDHYVQPKPSAPYIPSNDHYVPSEFFFRYPEPPTIAFHPVPVNPTCQNTTPTCYAAPTTYDHYPPYIQPPVKVDSVSNSHCHKKKQYHHNDHVQCCTIL